MPKSFRYGRTVLSGDCSLRITPHLPAMRVQAGKSRSSPTRFHRGGLIRASVQTAHERTSWTDKYDRQKRKRISLFDQIPSLLLRHFELFHSI
jgi:hypothetical protein